MCLNSELVDQHNVGPPWHKTPTMNCNLPLPIPARDVFLHRSASFPVVSLLSATKGFKCPKNALKRRKGICNYSDDQLTAKNSLVQAPEMNISWFF